MTPRMNSRRFLSCAAARAASHSLLSGTAKTVDRLDRLLDILHDVGGRPAPPRCSAATVDAHQRDQQPGHASVVGCDSSHVHGYSPCGPRGHYRLAVAQVKLHLIDMARMKVMDLPLTCSARGQASSAPGPLPGAASPCVPVGEDASRLGTRHPLAAHGRLRWCRDGVMPLRVGIVRWHLVVDHALRHEPSE